MKTRLINILLILVVSLSMNAGEAGISKISQESEFEVLPKSVDNAQHSLSDDGLSVMIICSDTISTQFKNEPQITDTITKDRSINVCKHQDKSNEAKITMLDLLLKWIVLLLELS